MNTSIYRERFALTMDHRPVDRCPIDLAGMPQSTIEDPRAVEQLAAHLGLSGAAPSDYGKFDRRILERFDSDFRRVGELVCFRTDRDRVVSETESVDGYGIRHRFTGVHWEIVESPLATATADDVAAYELPTLARADAHRFGALAQQAQFLFEQSPYVVVGEHPVFGVLELACWICGYERVMVMMALEPELVHVLFGKILAFQKGIIREYYHRIGPLIHMTTSGDDFGTQQGPFISPAMWREFVMPYMKERIAYTRQFTDAVYLHHSCGAIFELIPLLIETGVQVLNPIQPVPGMEPSRLKEAYGEQIVFHGGLDTQAVLPSNKPATIDESVERLIRAMSPGTSGGYIFAPAHNFQADVQPAAIAQMYGSALSCQGFPSGACAPGDAM